MIIVSNCKISCDIVWIQKKDIAGVVGSSANELTRKVWATFKQNMLCESGLKDTPKDVFAPQGSIAGLLPTLWVQLDCNHTSMSGFTSHCYETRFNPNVPQLTCSLQIIISHIYISHFIDFLKYFTGSLTKKGRFYLFSLSPAKYGCFRVFLARFCHQKWS